MVALIACAVVYYRMRSSDLAEHSALKDTLQRIEQIDSDLAKAVLASRYGLVNQYDALTRISNELQQSRISLDSQLKGALHEDHETSTALIDLADKEGRLRSDIEKFKTQNSVLKNSLFYLPEAGESLAGELRLAGIEPADSLARQIDEVVQATLVYNLLKTGTLRESLTLQQAELESRSSEIPPATLPSFRLFLRHARTVLKQQEVVDPLVSQISGGTVNRAAGHLEHLADEHLRHELARADRYRLALNALVLTLGAALVAIGYKLRRLYANLEQQVADRTRHLAEEKRALEVAERLARLNEARINAIIDGAREGIVRLGSNGQVRSYNPAAAQLFESRGGTTLGEPFLNTAVSPSDRDGFRAWLSRIDTSERIDTADCWRESSLQTVNGRTFLAECSMARRDPSLDEDTTLFVRDISAARRLETELRQAQKLESVGRLASGIAHEINTPIQFVSDSCHFVRESFAAMRTLLAGYGSLLTSPTTLPSERVIERMRQLDEEADLAYVEESMPKALDTMADGLQRVAELVAGMKTFAHPDQREMLPVDLNRALASTLVIARNEYKYVADLRTDFVQLPPVTCHAGEVNQVILNIIVNAAHAISEVVAGTDSRGQIAVRSRVDGPSIVISISDTGAGIPLAARDRIFDPFFTTKEVGKGTGQGLAIARSVVVEKHHGELTFESELGKGTTFFIRLPIEQESVRAATAA